MSDTTTNYYGFTKPEVGASNDTWGTKLNTNLDLIDSQINNARTVADAAMPKSWYTAADILSKLKTVDGPSSGVDADLLDSQQGSFYTNATNLNAGTIQRRDDSIVYGVLCRSELQRRKEDSRDLLSDVLMA